MINASLSAIDLIDICFDYGTTPLFRDFCLSVSKNEVTGIMGKSGCGKTTLLRIMAGLEKPKAGSIVFFDQAENSRVSYIFQEHRLLPWLTVEQNIRLPLDNYFSHTEAQERADYYLNKTGLFERRKALPSQISGGECQRTSLARAFAFPSNVLLMDEPFQAQDAASKRHLYELFSNLLAEQQKTVVLVTHDENEAKTLTQRLIRLEGSPVTVESKKL